MPRLRSLLRHRTPSLHESQCRSQIRAVQLSTLDKARPCMGHNHGGFGSEGATVMVLITVLITVLSACFRSAPKIEHRDSRVYRVVRDGTHTMKAPSNLWAALTARGADVALASLATLTSATRCADLDEWGDESDSHHQAEPGADADEFTHLLKEDDLTEHERRGRTGRGEGGTPE